VKSGAWTTTSGGHIGVCSSRRRQSSRPGAALIKRWNSRYDCTSIGVKVRWKRNKPLPCVNCFPPIPAWTCDRCLQDVKNYPARVAEWIARDKESQRLERQKREAERAADRVRLEYERRTKEALASNVRRYANVVLTYRGDGTRSTHFFYTTYKKLNGITQEIALQYGPDFEVLAGVISPNASFQVIQGHFNEYMAKFQQNCVHVVSATEVNP
jgi:hypothetical protein